jgi:hypothetical protein
MAKLTIDDIADLRAYEREREEFRRSVIDLKRRRRVPVGDFITLLFENTQTIRFRSRRWPGWSASSATPPSSPSCVPTTR